MSVHQFPEPVEIEGHTDLPDLTELVEAYRAFLPITEGNRSAAATLAIGAVLADAINRSGNT